MNREVERPVTIYTVAQHAGVSIATVSRVLQGSTPSSPATRTKVLDAVRELGYVPLRAGRSNSLRLEQHGLVLYSLGGPYYSELLVGYESRAPEFGQSVSLISTDGVDDLEDRVRDLAAKMDGLVLAHGTTSDELVHEVALKVPTLLLNRDPMADCPSVSVENRRATTALVDHLLQVHGHRLLWFIGDPLQARDAEHRYRGFTDALAAAGVTEAHKPIPVPFGETHAELVAATVVTHPTVEALVCANDELALGVIRQLRRRGVRVPEDLAVTGWDDVMAARYTGLTTVRQPAREVGRAAAQRLHELIVRSDLEPREVLVPSTLVVRSSCGCPEGFA